MPMPMMNAKRRLGELVGHPEATAPVESLMSTRLQLEVEELVELRAKCQGTDRFWAKDCWHPLLSRRTLSAPDLFIAYSDCRSPQTRAPLNSLKLPSTSKVCCLPRARGPRFCSLARVASKGWHRHPASRPVKLYDALSSTSSRSSRCFGAACCRELRGCFLPSLRLKTTDLHR
jgi:hypothetical protein